MKVYMRYWNYVVATRRQINPLIFSSVLVKDCVAKGKPMDDNGPVTINGYPAELRDGQRGQCHGCH